MKFTKEQKEALWADFKALPTAKKVDYIFDYYKWPIILAIVAVIIIVSTVVRTVTRKNDTLYLAAVNVSFGSETESTLTEDFIEYEGLNTKRNQVYLYTAMYLSENPSEVDHEYAYASRMKLMAAVNAQEMDVFLMNREAYDLLSQSGYLAELGSILTDELYSAVEPYLTENDVIIEDNKLDVLLNEADERQTVTESYVNAMSVSDSDVLRSAGFEGDVYFGVAVNTPRPDVAADYIAYLTGN